MKKIIIVIVLLFATQAYSQKLHFKVVNAESLEGISLAKVSSGLNKDYNSFSDPSGMVVVNYVPGDTITISKKEYHSIHLYLPQVNIDSIHTITVSMVPATDSNIPNVKQISNLSMFEYYFVHKNEEKNNVKIQVFENNKAIQQRENSSFKIASVHLNDFHKHQKKQ